MFFLDGYTGSLREHSSRTFLDFGSPKGGHGIPKLPVCCHLGEPKDERNALLFLKAPRKVLGGILKRFGMDLGDILCVFLDMLSMVLLFEVV